MRVLVTGGAGFIGSNVTKLLYNKGYEIYVYDNFSTGYINNLNSLNGLKIIKGDIRDKESLESAIKGCEFVFHLAAHIGNVKSLENPVEDSEINVLGTLNVLECSRINKVKKIVYSSSAAIFGEPHYQPIDEKHPQNPDSPYGVSKLAAEKHCMCYNRIYDIDIVCLRYFNVYGVNQRYDAYGNVIPIFATLLLQDKPIKIYDDGEQTRDFVNVKDIAKANLMAAEKQELSGVFNIGSGKSITINSLANMMKNIINKDAEIIYSPPRKGEIRHSKADISLARDSFGFNPSDNVYENLLEYIHWLKECWER
ncbi:NAD-dependent epimerase/dehydratase family protein [Candidatus Poribacteria bacterium]|nr:NAD-dependent epimerase/dehydratase family protein [Candidatus Poribacteria bacterium]